MSHPKNSYSTRPRCGSVTSVSLSSPCDASAAPSSTCASAPSLTSANKKNSAPGETPAAGAGSSGRPSQPHREVTGFHTEHIRKKATRLSQFKCWQLDTSPSSLYSHSTPILNPSSPLVPEKAFGMYVPNHQPVQISCCQDCWLSDVGSDPSCRR